jgi:3-hydroxypropanoate dehydrogenase
MTAVLSDDSLDLIFRSARTFNDWLDRPVDDARVRDVYDLMKWGPTSANSNPARFVWVRSANGKATLAGLAADVNRPKILAAPVTVIVGHDMDFASKLPKLMPHAAEMMQKYFAPPEVAEATAMRNGTLQGATSSSPRGRWDWTAVPCPASTTRAWTRRSSRARGSSRTSSAASGTAIRLPSSRETLA